MITVLKYITTALLSVFILLLSCKNQGEKPTITPNVTATLCGVIAPIDLNQLGPPEKREQMGNCHLKVSTQNPLAQEWIDYGINLLHGFWHLEAYRAFNEAVKADSTCAMAYWGIAMCQPAFGMTQQTTWNDAINKAMALRTGISPLEQALIEASDILVKHGLAAAQDKFRALYKRFPDEPEAITFAAIVLRQHQDENTQQEVKKLLEGAMKRFPDHIGLLHYYVHVMETRPDEFQQAFPAAERLLKLAPNSPHIRHMPGHLYFLAGNYKRTAEIFEETRNIEKAWHQKEQVPFVANENYMHNLHYLAVAYSELGDMDKAMEAAESYANITMDRPDGKNTFELVLLYEGRILPARVLIRFGEYEAAMEKINFWLNSVDFPLKHPMVRYYLQAMRLYCSGMSAIKKGDVAKATSEGGELVKLSKEFETLGLKQEGSPEYKLIVETFEIMNMAIYELAGWIDNIDPAKPFQEMAWQEAFKLEESIGYDEPPRLMYPIAESLMALHLFRGDSAKAKNATILALKKRPNSPFIKARLSIR